MIPLPAQKWANARPRPRRRLWLPMRLRAPALFCWIAAVFFIAPAGLADENRQPPKAAIASAHPLATAAGFEILEAGGNAFDAAVAVSAALAVVEPRGSGMGGGGFYLLHLAAEDRPVFVDARETAPAAASGNMFLDARGEVLARRSLDTALAAAIPGEPAGWAHLAARYGRLPLHRSLQPAIGLARNGFAAYPRLIEDIEQKREALLRSPDGRRIFLADGAAPATGALFKQRDLARSLEVLARNGAEDFYQGPFAAKLVAGVRKLGGIWSREDLQDYAVIEREPLEGRFGEARIVTAPPPSAGGVTLLEALNILSGYDLAARDNATRKHLIAESLRRAHRDRAEYLGDPAFVSIPLQRLLSRDYAAGLRASISLDRATPSDLLPGSIENQAGAGAQTTHFSILDKQGNRVAATITLNASMGSGLVIPGTGILLNNQMDDFAAKPGAANLYGLIGAEANAIAPGKRPLSSMTPTFVETGTGLLILGSPGGSFIPTMVLLGTLDWLQGAGAEQIVAAPRLHHQYRPDAIFHEDAALTAPERATLQQRGHQLLPWPPNIGNMQVVIWNYPGHSVSAAADPRGVGQGMAR